MKLDYVHSVASDLPPGVWAPFAEGATARAYAPEQLVYLQGSEAERFYYVLDGKVKSFISSDEGGERILTVCHGGDLMGEASFFDELPRVSSACALTHCRIVAIDRTQVREVFERHPELVFAMLKYLSRTVRILSGHVDSAFLRVDQRVARYLLSLSGGAIGPVHCTNEELGFSVGASRVTVNRVLNEFARQGMVKTGYKSVVLLDLGALRQRAEVGT